MNRPIHFITYANDKFKQAKNRILQEAKDFYNFQSVTGYGPEDLSELFVSKFKNILERPRGGGYWIWRPIILYNKMSSLKEGEFLVYLDAGCHLNKNGLKRFNEYIDMLEKSDYGVMSFQMSGNNSPGSLEKEKYWSVKEVFEYFNVSQDSEIGNSGQYLGGILILKKNKHIMEILELFIKALYDDPEMFTDFYNNKPQHKEFKENRHEQSVFSILRKIRGSVVIDGDESWMVPFGRGKSLEYPFWALRSKI